MATLRSKAEVKEFARPGDLMLAWSKPALANGGSPILGIYRDIETHTSHGDLIFDDSIFLREPVIIDGVSRISADMRHDCTLSFSQFEIGYTGISNITWQLESDDEIYKPFSRHSEWIRRLEKPYRLPKVKAVTKRYLDV